MTSIERAAARFRVAVAAAALAVAAAACQGGGSAPPTAGSSPSATMPQAESPAAPTPTAAAAASSAVRLFGPLAAGTYTTATFTPAVTFTVPDGWIAGSEIPESFSIRFGTADKFHQVTFARVVGGDPLGIARTNPVYRLGQPVSTTVAGKSATEVSLTLSIDAIQKSFYPLAKTISDGDGTLDLLQRGTQARVITVDVTGGPLVILIQRPLGASDPFDAAAQAVLDSLHLP